MRKFILAVFFTCLAPPLFCEPPPPKAPSPISAEQKKEQLVETEHKILTSKGVELKYTASCGTVILKDGKDEPQASIFYVAYRKRENKEPRPVTFCFNGGPGSSAIWLHLGIFGPKTIALDHEGEALFPYHLEENPYTLLESSDLVFIDPVSTGYSKALPGDTEKQFHGVDEDIKSVAEFIRIYVTRNNLWEVPKFIAGESYGTTRAAGLAEYLQTSERMYLNGIILISSILDFQTIFLGQETNDLPFILALPTYTAAAWYHKKIDPERKKELLPLLKEAEAFASKDYALALFSGDSLSASDKESMAKQLSGYTGLSEDYLLRSNLRVSNLKFAKELLRQKNRSIGRFDARFLGYEADSCKETIENDPSLNQLLGAFASTFNYYIRNDLKWISDASYNVIADVTPWNFGKAINQYLNLGGSLRNAVYNNPLLHVFVASGYYDLATPYYATEYTFKHLGLNGILKENVTMKTYDGGHMMYTDRRSLIALCQDLSTFFQKATRPNDKTSIKTPFQGESNER